VVNSATGRMSQNWQGWAAYGTCVVINDRMTAADHVSKLLETCTRLLYVLRVLRQHGLSSTSMNDVFRATVLAKLLYCASAWSGFCSAADRERLDTFVRRCKRLCYSDDDIPKVAEMFENTDDTLFSRIIRNDKHVLQHYLPERNKIQCNLRPRQHSKQLISTELNNRDYIVRMLYKDAYWRITQ